MFVFWYHSPNVLDTPHICDISRLRVNSVEGNGRHWWPLGLKVSIHVPSLASESGRASGSNESNSSVCGVSRAGLWPIIYIHTHIYPSLAPESSSPRQTREPDSYVCGVSRAGLWPSRYISVSEPGFRVKLPEADSRARLVRVWAP
jgi:hypothetical protein